jgi:putative PIN family toxin of toxin-antitoxin system
MLRAVVDTNVLVSRFLSESGPPARLFDLLGQERFTLILSQEIKDQYAEVLLRPYLMQLHGWESERIKRAINKLFRAANEIVPTARLPGVIADPKDDKFIECAVAGEADLIVSGDRHLLELGSFEGIRIVTPAVFVSFLEWESPEA